MSFWKHNYHIARNYGTPFGVVQPNAVIEWRVSPAAPFFDLVDENGNPADGGLVVPDSRKFALGTVITTPVAVVEEIVQEVEIEEVAVAPKTVSREVKGATTPVAPVPELTEPAALEAELTDDVVDSGK